MDLIRPGVWTGMEQAKARPGQARHLKRNVVVVVVVTVEIV